MPSPAAMVFISRTSKLVYNFWVLLRRIRNRVRKSWGLIRIFLCRMQYWTGTGTENKTRFMLPFPLRCPSRTLIRFHLHAIGIWNIWLEVWLCTVARRGNYKCCRKKGLVPNIRPEPVPKMQYSLNLDLWFSLQNYSRPTYYNVLQIRIPMDPHYEKPLKSGSPWRMCICS